MQAICRYTAAFLNRNMEKPETEGKIAAKQNPCSGCLMYKAFKSLQLFKKGDISMSPSMIKTLRSCREIFDTILSFADEGTLSSNGYHSCRCMESCYLREQKDVAVSTSSVHVPQPENEVSVPPEPVVEEPNEEPIQVEEKKEDTVESAIEVPEPVPEKNKPKSCKCRQEKSRPKLCKCKTEKLKPCKPCNKKATFKEKNLEYIKLPCDCKKDVKTDKTKNLCKCPPVIIFDKPPAKRNFFEIIKCLLPGDTIHLGKCACDQPEKKASMESNYTIETLSYSNKDPSSTAMMNSKSPKREKQIDVSEKFNSRNVTARQITTINRSPDRKVHDTKQVNFLLYENVLNVPVGDSLFPEKLIKLKYRKLSFNCKVLRKCESEDCEFRDSEKLKTLKLKSRYTRSYSDHDYSQYDLKEIFKLFHHHKMQQEKINHARIQRRHRIGESKCYLSNRSAKLSKIQLLCIVLAHDFNVKLFILSYIVCLTYFVTSMWIFQ